MNGPSVAKIEIATSARALATFTPMGLLDNKLGIVFGVANKRSIAWAIAQAWL